MSGATVTFTVKKVFGMESTQLGRLIALFSRSDEEMVAAIQKAGGFEEFLHNIKPLLLPSYAVILGNDEKSFVMYVGENEGGAIARLLDGVTTPRPMTNDLCLSFAEALRGTITRAVIAKIEDNTFFGELTLRDHEGKEHAIDCRSSDLIALAMASKVSIEVSEAVLQSVPDASEFLRAEGREVEITVPVHLHFGDEDDAEKSDKVPQSGANPDQVSPGSAATTSPPAQP